MIIHLKKNINAQRIEEIAHLVKAIFYVKEDTAILITRAALQELPKEIENDVDQFWPMKNDLQLANKLYRSERRTVKMGNTIIGGSTNNVVLIGGPCSVESLEQIDSASVLMKELNLSTLRGGCYKPRTSPYSFQGLGLEGLKMLDKMREKYGLNVVTEVRDATQIEEVIEYSDVIQVGAKAMYDQGILRACAKTQKPVLIKRGFGSTLQEFAQAAEFVLSGGNENVILCERGIRTFETGTRFTLDLCGVAWLKEYTNLPIVLDPSHAMGYAYGIADLSKACLAMGVDGLLIEVHPDPKQAKSDAAQQLNYAEFTKLVGELKAMAGVLNYNLV
jgi:3-deoxy-7-phosphoheptulonate synthase